MEAQFLRDEVERYSQRRCVDAARAHAHGALGVRARGLQLVISGIFQAFGFQDITKSHRRARRDVRDPYRCAAQILKRLIIFLRHDKKTRPIDDARGNGDVEIRFDGGNKCVGGSDGNVDGLPHQRHRGFFRAAHQYEIDRQTFPIKITHPPRYPHRNESDRFRSNADGKFRFLLARARSGQEEKQNKSKAGDRYEQV